MEALECLHQLLGQRLGRRALDDHHHGPAHHLATHHPASHHHDGSADHRSAVDHINDGNQCAVDHDHHRIGPAASNRYHHRSVVARLSSGP